MFSLLAPVPAVPGVGRFSAVAEAGAHGSVNPWVALAYLISGVFFILALRGLSSPATSRKGNRFGMIGMLIAVVTTLVTHFPWVTEQQLSYVFVTRPDWASMSEILIAIAIGANTLMNLSIQV